MEVTQVEKPKSRRLIYIVLACILTIVVGLSYPRFGLSDCTLETSSEDLQLYGNRLIGFSICLPTGWERDYSINSDLEHLGEKGIFANFMNGNDMIILDQVYPDEHIYTESNLTDVISFAAKFKLDREDQLGAEIIMDETVILQNGKDAKILAYRWGKNNDTISLVMLIADGDSAYELRKLYISLEDWESLKDLFISSFSTLRVF